MKAGVAAIVALASLMLAAPGTAQLRPVPGDGDPRLQTVAFEPDRIVRLVAAPGSSMTLILSASERIVNVTLGDNAAFEVGVASAGDSLFIRPLVDNATTNMTVLTDARSYTFELAAAYAPDAAYVVRFTYPAQVPPPPADPQYILPAAIYTLKGDRALKPVRIEDDGMRTFIEWSPEQMLPAVFAYGPTGEEQVVDGYMRGGVFVIDRVHPKLVFRIDRDSVTATRRESEEAK